MIEPEGRGKPKDYMYFGEQDIAKYGRPIRDDMSKLDSKRIEKVNDLVAEFASGKTSNMNSLNNVMPNLYQLGMKTSEKVRVILYKVHGYEMSNPKEGIYVVVGVYANTSDKSKPADIERAVLRVYDVVADEKAIVKHFEQMRARTIGKSNEGPTGKTR